MQVSRSSNTFEDVIEGVTLTAKKVDVDAQTIKVSNSNFSVQGKVKEFIDSYNRLVEGIDSLTSFNTDTQQCSILFGDSTVTQIISSLRSHLTAAIPGSSEFSNLSSIGIKVGQDGKFSLDGAAFNDALNDDLDAVSRLFVRSINSANSSVKFLDATANTTVGTYDLNVTQAAEQAAITGTQVVGGGGITAAERLVITHNESATIVTLAAGSTLSQIIDQLNTAFTDNGLAAQASDDGGKLRISATAYGSSEEIGISSDQADSDPNQLGIGTTKLTDTGEDVAGTINGQSVTGTGRELTGPALSLAEGLRLEISATAPFSTKVTFNKGLSASVIETIDNLTDSTSGLFAARESSFNAQIAQFDQRIEDLGHRLDIKEAGLRKKFVALEIKISTLQAQGNFLLSQLSSLIPANR